MIGALVTFLEFFGVVIAVPVAIGVFAIIFGGM